MSIRQSNQIKKYVGNRRFKKARKKILNKNKQHFVFKSATAEEIRNSLSLTDKNYAAIEKEIGKILPKKKANQLRKIYAH